MRRLSRAPALRPEFTASLKNMKIKLASWNVNGLRACGRKGFLDFVRAFQPDLLCLQETKAHPEELNDPALKNGGGLEFAFFSSSVRRKGYSGTAVFSRQKPLRAFHSTGIRKFDREGRFAIAEFQKFILLSVYFPNGSLTEERHFFKQEFLSRFTDYALSLESRSGKPLIIAGDWNTAYLDIDVHSPSTLQKESGFLPEERRWLTDFLSAGFVDSFRFLHPSQESAFTWWSYREHARELNRGWRIDHIIVSEALKSRLLNVKIWPQQRGSDHCPITAELKLDF